MPEQEVLPAPPEVLLSPEADGHSPQSPEARRKRAEGLRHSWQRGYARVRPGSRFFEIVKRVAIGVFYDGFIHAGNLAYMAILSLFPFFITATAILSLLGQSQEGLHALNVFLETVPKSVSDTIAEPVRSVMTARSGSLLWLGGLFGLWTVGSLIETIRDILRRAYGTKATKALWRYRLGSAGIIIGAVLLLLISFSAQIVITALQQAIEYILPQFGDWTGRLSLSRLVPAIGLFVSLYLIFVTLTPSKYRSRRYPKWPGALITALWWVGVTALLPFVLHYLASYDLTYGSLAGIMITLFFFYLVGLGVVIGAELNAALVESPVEQNMIGQADDRERAAAEALEAKQKGAS